jgi:DNA-binding GntR family transcriptional regulator
VEDIASLIQPMLQLWEDRQAHHGSADAVHATLREAILSKLLTSEHFFAEDDLARAFGVSRTPVREAVLRLESEHLLERRGRRRLSVSAISPEEVLEIYDVRVVLDGLAASLAAKKATPPDVSQLRWLNDQLRECGEKDDPAGMMRLNLEFHDTFAKAGKNWFLINQLRGVQDRVRRFERSTFEYPDRWKGVLEEHEAIILAIESHNSRAAEQAAKTHMRNSKHVRLDIVRDQGSAAEPVS